jgi:predicted O-methyltransferase YrrM
MLNPYPNWFSVAAEKFFTKNLIPYSGKPLRCLQLGAYTGDATEWLFKNVLTHPDSFLIDVDTWEGSDEDVHKAMDWSSVEDIYTTRNQDHIDSGKLIKYKGTTDQFFSGPSGKQKFDFIYVDADHEAASALKDGLNSLYRLEMGGLLAFDDYVWQSGKGAWANPKFGVDSILACYSHKLNIIDIGAQVWVTLNSPLEK